MMSVDVFSLYNKTVYSRAYPYRILAAVNIALSVHRPASVVAYI